MKIEGIVVHGKQLGRTLGFPTANLQPLHQSGEGPNGVYAAWFYVDGQRLGCMVNIGHHPTLPEGGKTVEAHIFDFSQDIYGKPAELETVSFLRGEQKFASPEELRQQLTRDAEKTRAILNIQTPPGIE